MQPDWNNPCDFCVHDKAAHREGERYCTAKVHVYAVDGSLWYIYDCPCLAFTDHAV